MDHDLAIQLLFWYMDNCMFEARLSWPEHEFRRRSYARTAVEELIDRISDHPFIDPVDIVEIFILETEYYKQFAEGKPSWYWVYVENETAIDILSLFKLKGANK